MYYIGKILQALGLGIVLFAFIQRFPELMSYKTLFFGILIFTTGWLINRSLLKR